MVGIFSIGNNREVTEETFKVKSALKSRKRQYQIPHIKNSYKLEWSDYPAIIFDYKDTKQKVNGNLKYLLVEVDPVDNPIVD